MLPIRRAARPAYHRLMRIPALHSLARYGPFFALDVPSGPGTVGVCEPGLGPLLAARVFGVREQLIGDRLDPTLVRACASVVHLDLVSRLLSPALGLAVAGAGMPAPERVTVLASPAGLRFGLRTEPAAVGGAQGFESALATAQILTAAVDDVVALPPRLTRSNIASALAGAATVIGAHDRELGAAAVTLLRELLAGPLRGTGRLGADSVGAGGFRRQGCCLYYRLPGGGVCGDCVLEASSSVR